MNAGALRHKVTLENPTVVQSGAEGHTVTWATLAQDWASIEPATARDLERAVAGTVQSTATHLVRLRYRAGVTTATRIRFGTRTLQVTGVQNPSERNVELVLTCEEVVG